MEVNLSASGYKKKVQQVKAVKEKVKRIKDNVFQKKQI